MRDWARAHRGFVTATAAAALALLGLGIYWFAPQRLLLDRQVSEALPSPAEMSEDGAGDPADAVGDGVMELASGRFRSLEHRTIGFARIVQLEDGARFVRLEELDTSDGPDLRIYLTDQPVSDDWRVWDDGDHVDLGALKGNLGDSNYRIPDDVDLSRFKTVVIWCRRFTVGFGVAPV